MKKEKILSPEELKRKEIARTRCFWVLLGFILLLIVTFVFEILVIVLPH